MVYFNQRNAIAKDYDTWCKKNNVKDCPLSVISYLEGKGFLNEEIIKEEYPANISSCNTKTSGPFKIFDRIL